ncbi:MAG: hypothetical protein LBV41_00335 [Cytophagaceae bacterium]|jgi:hypothetical protein|nr:hypothetical protein [Cytophagaceae bacterium]
MEELYINEQKVDIGEALITMKYQSNILGDIDAILSSYTYTIQCPKTANNTQIFAQSDMPSQATSNRILRRYNNAKYYRNGIEIFVGKALMLEATAKSFKIFLKWGELEELVTFLNESVNLNEAFDQSFAMLWNQDSVGNYNADNSAGFFPYETPAFNGDIFNTHPSVRFSKIISLIEEKSGLQFIFSPSIQQRLRNTVLLCNTKNDTKESSYLYSLIANITGDVATEGSIRRRFQFNASSVSNAFKIENGFIYSTRNIDKITLEINISTVQYFNINSGEFFIVNDAGDKVFSAPMLKSNDGLSLYLLRGQIEIEAKLYAGTILYCYMEAIVNGGMISPRPNKGGYININQSYNDDDFGEVPFPGWFPVYANLPSISTNDFIKSIGWMFGLYATRRLSDAKNIVRFEPVDVLYDNKPRAVSWGNKVINRDSLTPSSLKYRRDGMAQKNKLTYKEDVVLSVAAITVNDETLARSVDLITLPYAASRNNTQGMALIPQYIYENGDFQFVEVAPRALNVVNDSGPEFLNFDTLDFPTLVAKYYTGFQKMMLHPVVMTEIFRLTELDLKNLDFTIPVYLEQYGMYYGIISIQDQEGICEVQLLQL